MKHLHKRTLFLIVLWGAGWASMGGATTPAVRQVKARELIDKYAEIQDKIKSYLCRCEVSSEMDALLTEAPYTALSGQSKSNKVFEFRYDGSRYSMRLRHWGNVRSATKSIPEDQCPYNSVLWNGKTYFEYTTAGAESGRVWIARGAADFVQEASENSQIEHQRNLRYGPGIGVLKGFLGENDRIDAVLRKSLTLSLHDKTVTINGSECPVLEGMGESYSYVICLDPRPGYNIVKVECRSRQSDSSFTVENVRCEKIKEVWVPMEATVNKVENLKNGDYIKTVEHIRVTEMILNPDHDALDSFVPDDIHNRAFVIVAGDKESEIRGPGRNPRGKYMWQDGQVVDGNDKPVLDFRKKP
jgi:hypothetical protein